MKIVSLMYHDVVENDNFDAAGFPGPEAANYKLDVRNLQNHFSAIRSSMTEQPTTITSIKESATGKIPLLLTFDDGGISSITHISNVLKQFGWIGHFFITAGLIGKPGFVHAEHVRQLHEQGHIIGSHSYSHIDRMFSQPYDVLVDEWSKSVSVLSDIIGTQVETASVPGGFFSKRVAVAAAECGIQSLFTSEPVKKACYVGNCLVIGRYAVVRKDPPEHALKLAQQSLSTEQMNQFIYWNFKKYAKKLGGTYYLKMRTFIFEKMKNRNIRPAKP